MRLFVFVAAVASLVLAYFFEPLVALASGQGSGVVLPTVGVLAMVLLALFNLWVLVISNVFTTVAGKWVLTGVIVGLIGGFIGFDLVIQADWSEVAELGAALLLFCLPLAIATALACDWFPWRVVRKGVAV